MMDVTFGLGASCDKRIVVYNDTGLPYDWIRNVNMVLNFILLSSANGIETYHARWNFGTCGVGFSDCKPFLGPDKLNKIAVPYKAEDFNRAEYNLYYNDRFNTDHMLADWPVNWMDCEYTHYVECSALEIGHSWNEKGTFLAVEAKSNWDKELLQYVLDYKYEDLKEKFNPFNIEIERESDKPVVMTLAVSERPFDEFVYANESEKYTLVKDVYEKEQDLVRFFTELAIKLEEVSDLA
jgi:hypothetical protein